MNETKPVPSATTFTSAPLRHRLRVELAAPVAEVWALVGDHVRMPEYTAGVASVVVEGSPHARVCQFRAPDGSATGPVARELLRWEAPNVGYAATGEPGNAFGLIGDLSLVTVAPAAQGTVFTWEQYYDGQDLPAMRASFDDAFADIGQRLVARFGGRVVERYIDGPR